MQPTYVFRCATCGAPLEGTAGTFVIRCVYCDCENRLVAAEAEHMQAHHARFAQASEEAHEMARDLDARGAELMAAFQRESARALEQRDPDAAYAALRHFEGYLRLQYAPTLHLYKSAGDPRSLGALTEIDQVIDRAVAEAAKGLGVPYRTTAERLGQPRLG